MKKLKKKIFYLIFTVLTITVLVILFIFQIQNYYQQKSIIENSINTTSQMEKDKRPDMHQQEIQDPQVYVMDSSVCVVLLNEQNEIADYINMSTIDENTIEDIANKIIERNDRQIYVGNLYFEDYSYEYLKNQYIIVVDHTTIQDHLYQSLISSCLLFVFVEIILAFSTKKITSWVIKPVEETFEKQKQFIGDASHELKTPLSLIIGGIETLKKNPEETKWIEHIENESLRMNDLIKRLLELTGSENSEYYHFEHKNLSKIIELAILPYEAKAYEQGLWIDTSIEEDIYHLIDPEAIEEVVIILLDNALKHAYDHTHILVSLKRKDRKIELMVQNTGDPIPEGEEKNIFERFYRIDKARNRKENRYGLGLAIAKNIVEHHKGYIFVESDIKKTSFFVII